MKRIVVSDCEGPISRNDNAYEITSESVPNGNRLYTVISRYDDALADVLRRPNYKSGDTLKLILPFLMAYGVTDQGLDSFSSKNLLLIPYAKDTLQRVRGIAPAFIVSTSYEHYIRNLCKALEFPFENTYCTQLSIDTYHLAKLEKTRLREIATEIAQMSVVDIVAGARSMEDLTREDQQLIERLDQLFWKEIASMECGRVYTEVNPIGGSEKARAINNAVKRSDTTLSNVMYIGDSITDVEAFALVRKNRGLTVSFNGNQYAVKNAEIAVLSDNDLVIAVIADIFCRFDRDHTMVLVEDWNRETLEKSGVDRALLQHLFGSCPNGLPKVKIITNENMEVLAQESSSFREKVRGELIGRLG